MKHYFCINNGTIWNFESSIKNIFDRERPTLLRLIDITGFSFPSGHAMGSTAYFGSGIYLLNRLNQGNSKGILIGFMCSYDVLLISISRVYLGYIIQQILLPALLVAYFALFYQRYYLEIN